MEEKMFCFQCEQTANCSGCKGNAGVCGKSYNVANTQDEITGSLISLARKFINAETRDKNIYNRNKCQFQ